MGARRLWGARRWGRMLMSHRRPFEEVLAYWRAEGRVYWWLNV
jgi:hypothetical protein